MESSLHRALKERYASPDAEFEVPLGKYRIDVMEGDRLIEIQHGPLAAIRDKVLRLAMDGNPILVVKPIVAQKTLVKRKKKDGPIIDRRASPKRLNMLSIFDDLVHFTRCFPHPNVGLEAVMVEIEEWRYPGHGRRRRWRANDFQVEDRKLVSIGESKLFETPADLACFVNAHRIDSPFDTADLAQHLSVDRWVAQRIAYCLRKMRAIRAVGKKGNALLYEVVRAKRTCRRQAKSQARKLA